MNFVNTIESVKREKKTEKEKADDISRYVNRSKMMITESITRSFFDQLCNDPDVFYTESGERSVLFSVKLDSEDVFSRFDEWSYQEDDNKLTKFNSLGKDYQEGIRDELTHQYFSNNDYDYMDKIVRNKLNLIFVENGIGYKVRRIMTIPKFELPKHVDKKYLWFGIDIEFDI